jgi:hypothetical protein
VSCCWCTEWEEYDQDDEDNYGEGDDGTYVRRYEVYTVDLDAGTLIPSKGLNGRAVFMGMSRAISVPAAGAFPFATPDTIYLGVDCDRKTREYNVADGVMEQARILLWRLSPLLHPGQRHQTYLMTLGDSPWYFGGLQFRNCIFSFSGFSLVICKGKTVVIVIMLPNNLRIYLFDICYPI